MGAANTGGSGNSKSEMKKKAEKDTQVSAYEKEINKQNAAKKAKEKTKTTTPKDNNKVTVPKDDNRDKQKVIVPKKKIDFKPVTKEVLNPNDNIQEKKKTPIVKPKYEGGGEGGAVKKPVVVKEVTKTAPTIAEVDQATTDTTPTETAETTEKNRLLKVKKRGRSSSIMTSAKGVTKTSSDYSLGRSSLLGRV
jgi:hypothetical protein